MTYRCTMYKVMTLLCKRFSFISKPLRLAGTMIDGVLQNWAILSLTKWRRRRCLLSQHPHLKQLWFVMDVPIVSKFNSLSSCEKKIYCRLKPKFLEEAVALIYGLSGLVWIIFTKIYWLKVRKPKNERLQNL